MKSQHDQPVDDDVLVLVKIRGNWTTSPQPAVKFLWNAVQEWRLAETPA